MEIVSNGYYVFIKIMFLCKNQEDILKWVMFFLLFISTYHNLFKKYYKTMTFCQLFLG